MLNYGKESSYPNYDGNAYGTDEETYDCNAPRAGNPCACATGIVNISKRVGPTYTATRYLYSGGTLSS